MRKSRLLPKHSEECRPALVAAVLADLIAEQLLTSRIESALCTLDERASDRLDAKRHSRPD